MKLALSWSVIMTIFASMAPIGTSLAAGEFGNPVDVEFKADVDGSLQRYVEILQEMQSIKAKWTNRKKTRIHFWNVGI